MMESNKQSKLDAFLREIEELERRLMLVSLVDRTSLVPAEQISAIHASPSRASSASIRDGWNSTSSPSTTHTSPTPVVRRQVASSIQLKAMRYTRREPEKFVASQSLHDLEQIMHEQKIEKRKRKKYQHFGKNNSSSAPTIGVPSFVDTSEEARRRKEQRRRQQDQKEWALQKSPIKKIRPRTPKLSARLERLSQPGNAVNYEEFKAKMEQRKHDPFLGKVKMVPKKITEKTVQWLKSASKPKRPNKPYESEFKTCGFGGAGSRFVGESEFNKTPGPSKCKLKFHTE